MLGGRRRNEVHCHRRRAPPDSLFRKLFTTRDAATELRYSLHYPRTSGHFDYFLHRLHAFANWINFSLLQKALRRTRASSYGIILADIGPVTYVRVLSCMYFKINGRSRRINANEISIALLALRTRMNVVRKSIGI